MAVSKGTKAKTQKKAASAPRGKKSPEKDSKPHIPWAVLFWLAFIIFVFGLFLFNREAITRSIHIVQSELAAKKNPVGVEDPAPSPEPPTQTLPSTTPVTQPVPSTAPVASANQTPAAERNTSPSQNIPQAEQRSEAERSSEAVRSTQAEQRSEAVRSTQAEQRSEAVRSTAELRERTLYFIQVDKSGYIVRVQTNRRLPASEAPLTDVIQALIGGPNDNEKSRGLISLVPPGTKILSASVRGNTAYISFSEDFQYNTYGVEGYAGQIRQIVFTATEFPNVRDVQILIEGRRIDYLGEGIWIGSPLSREML